MSTWVLLLRGINVGGHHKLPMKDLAALLESAGCDQVRTYIQSGNVVFRAGIEDPVAFADEISGRIEDEHGFRPAIQLLTADALEAAVAANPYPEAVTEPKTLHVFFLASTPPAQLVEGTRELLTATERFKVVGNCLYLHAPDGLARSKFAARVDKAFGVSATSRNWNTVSKLAGLVASA